MKAALQSILAWLPPSLRQDPRYWRQRRFLAQAQFWSADQIAAWQWEQLRAVVRTAYDRTAGYRQLYQAAGVSPDDLRAPSDFARFPAVTKAMIQARLDDFTVRGPGLRYATTGGSSGIPFGFFHPSNGEAIEYAHMHTQWAWFGWQLDEPSAVLRGWGGRQGRAAEYHPYRRWLRLSSHHLQPEFVAEYAQALDTHRVAVLQAYPSSAELFARLALADDQLRAVAARLRLVLLGSENVYDWLLPTLEAAFPNARFLAWYGHSERAILAPWCEHSRQYHAWPFYGYTEILDARQQPVPAGTVGELAGTSFRRQGTLFLRYRTQDLAERGADACALCGRHFPLIRRVEGREHEFAVSRQGRLLSMTSINMHDAIFDPLLQFRFVQDSPGRVVFRYVARTTLRAEEADRIRTRLEQTMGPDMTVVLEPVAQIAPTPAGKHRFMEQQLDLAPYRSAARPAPATATSPPL